LIALVICLAFLIQGAPYVKSNDHDSAEIVKIAKKYRPVRVLDMGSGNGKLVIMLAKQGFKADGIELNPLLVWQSRRAIKKAGLQGKAKIVWGSFWKYDVSNYDMVTLYAIQHIMPRLQQKLTSELKHDSTIVSNYFTFPNKKPAATNGRLRIYKS
jgi:cyclopropane fatty-acyl-phospholipid synthase-like methyltransferase